MKRKDYSEDNKTPELTDITPVMVTQHTVSKHDAKSVKNQKGESGVT
jgi:hypothetical protein